MSLKGILLGVPVALLVPAAAPGQQVDLMSRAASPAAPVGRAQLPTSYASSISDDGRYSLFLSSAPNVIAGQVDLNNGNDAFVYDRATGTTVLASRASGSSVTTGTSPVSDAVISADGAYVGLISSEAFLFERATGLLRAVPGTYANMDSLALSADGRWLAFIKGGGPNMVTVYDRLSELATEIVYGLNLRMSADGSYLLYQDGTTNWYLRNRSSGSVVLVDHAVGAPSTPGNSSSGGAQLSGDGRFVAYWSYATNLVAGQVDSSDTFDVFVYDRVASTTSLVSHSPGSPTTAVGDSGGNWTSPLVSRDGRFVVFESRATGLLTGQADANGGTDIFLHDRTSGTNVLVTHAAGSLTTTANEISSTPTISTDGDSVAFRSGATNLVAGQQDGSPSALENDIFAFDRATGGISLVSHAAGQPTLATNPDNSFVDAAVSGNGAFVLFDSKGRGLLDGPPGNLEPDVFLYDRASTLNQLVSRAGRPSVSANQESHATDHWGAYLLGRFDRAAGTLSADGRYAVFVSRATNLVPGQIDTNGVADLFLFDRASGLTTLVTHAAGQPTTTANSISDAKTFAFSADASIVAFASTATNLLSGQIGTGGFFIFEKATGTVSLLNHAPGLPNTVQGTVGSLPGLSVSDDGRFVAANVYGDLGGGLASTHVLDRQTGTLSRVDGPGDSGGGEVAISTDGDYVAQAGANVVALFQRSTSNLTTIATGRDVTISGDGRFVAFQSTDTNLVSGQVDAPNTYDVFLYDRVSASTTLVSHALGSPGAATGAAGDEAVPVVSHDGNYVVFLSSATGLVAGQNDTNNAPDVFLFSRATGQITLVSHTGGSLTTAAAAGSTSPDISADGSVVAFSSRGGNLVSGQGGVPNLPNVFLFERATGGLTLASRALTGSAGNGDSQEPALSRSGSHVAFSGVAANLVGEDFNDFADAFIFGTCSAPPNILAQPTAQIVPIGAQATFSVVAHDAGGYQWQRNGVDIPGATGLYYSTPPVAAADSGTTYRVAVRGACGSQTISQTVTLTIADSEPPAAAVLSPAGGEYWLLSPSGGPPETEVVSWSMSDDVRICQVAVSLRYSSNGGATFVAAPAGGGLPVTMGTGGSCAYPGATSTNLTYTVPTTFPSGSSGSLYKVRVVVTDQAANVTTVESANPFYIVQRNPDNVRTIILSNTPRMQAQQGISAPQASALTAKLLELAAHPRVQGVVQDLGQVTALNTLYAAYDAAVTANNGTSAAKANDLLFAANGIHDYLRSVLAVYTGARHLVLVGDDRIVPFARMPDGTVLLRESAYTAGGDLRGGGTGVGQALAANMYLSDDPLSVRDSIRPADLSGSAFVPDLAVGRLVETPQEITTSIATFIGQNGILDLSTLDPVTGHKVLVTGYDFLLDGAKSVRTKWKGIFGASGTADSSLAPVDGSLISVDWGSGAPAARKTALRTHLSGNGGGAYGIVSLSGHASHYEEGVPGTDFTTIEGLSSAEIYGLDACATPGAGALTLAGSVIYAAGCHGGLTVPGSCRTDLDHSLDLPQTFLARGVTTYVANTGYGWGLRHGIGYGERLGELLTEELAAAGTVVIGDAVRRTKQRYFLETPRYDPYDQKSLMQWTVYGLPMYSVKTGVAGPSFASGSFPGKAPSAATLPLTDRLAGVGVRRDVVSGGAQASAGRRSEPVPQIVQPPYLTQVNLTFDLTAGGLYEKKNSSGDVVGATGCPDANGCYYALNGLATGNTDLPIQPYFVYDSRLSGTSQHGVLWKGGTYLEETDWKPVFSELFSTKGGADGSNHGAAPRLILIRPTAPRLVPGEDPLQCRSSDVEVNSLVVPTGEALKAESGDPVYAIERHYGTVDLEAFYFNNSSTPGGNCDREGPAIGAGPFTGGAYHEVSGRTVAWSVPATDPSEVWRVMIVSTDNSVDGSSRGSWVPTDLTLNPGSGRFEGSRTDLSGNSTRLTYVVQAVDKRGNVTWVDYTSASLPTSAVPLGLPLPLDVSVAPGTTVTGFAPSSGIVGASITVTGTNFVGVTQVEFGGVSATTFNVTSATQLTATVPVGAISGPIEVTASLGQGTSPTSFIVQAPPTITSFSPGSGPVGTLVNIVGTNLAGATTLSFNGTAAVFAQISPTELQAGAPSGATTGKLMVTTPYGSAQSASNFVVTASGSSTRFNTVAPCRALDTRSTIALTAGSTRVIALAGNCGIPGTARAVSLNVTVTGPAEAGNLQLYPSHVSAPPASALNYAAGQTRGNNAIIALSPTGEITVKANQASGTVHVILDVNGYFE